MSHPQHAKCPGCNKALFKSPLAAKVKPADPYAYCRNKACEQYTFRALGVDFDPKKAVKGDAARALKVGAKVRPAQHINTARAEALAAKDAAFLERKVNEHPGGHPTPAAKAASKAAKEARIAARAQPTPETKPTSKRGRKRAAVPASEAPKRPAEPEPIAKARRRLKELLGQVIPGGASKASAGLVLAILSQETGNHKAAEALIDEYKLDTTFGLQKFSALNG